MQKTIDHYEIISELGRGGMAVVYRARDLQLGREVALKILPRSLNVDKSFEERFIREAQMAAQLNHPNIVGIYHIGNSDIGPYIAMELLSGGSLQNLIKSAGALPSQKVIQIGLQVTSALGASHAKGIIHRDIKPENILFDNRGQIKVTDFGIAKARSSSNITMTGQSIGTPHYMSPEQARGLKADHRSDIYSLGVVLYEAVTGQVPFDAPETVAIALKHIQEKPLPPQELNNSVNAELNAIILHCLEKKPEQRFPSCYELFNTLQGKHSLQYNSVESKPIRVMEAGISSKSIRKFNFQSWRYPIIAFTAVLLIIISLIIIKSKISEDRSATYKGIEQVPQTNEISQPVNPIGKGNGIIFIESKPLGASVLIDNYNVGMKTPVTLENILKGVHIITLRKDGFQDVNTSVNILDDEVARLSMKLVKVNSRLTIITEPINANVYIDGKLEGKTPSTFMVATGAHKIRLVKPTFIETTLVVAVPKEGTKVNIAMIEGAVLYEKKWMRAEIAEELKNQKRIEEVTISKPESKSKKEVIKPIVPRKLTITSLETKTDIAEDSLGTNESLDSVKILKGRDKENLTQDSLKLFMKATRDSVWVQLFCDGVSWKNFLKPGNLRTFNAKDSINLHVGNNSIMKYRLNGKKMSLGGGGVKIFKFDHNGVKQWQKSKWNSVFKGRL